MEFILSLILLLKCILGLTLVMKFILFPGPTKLYGMKAHKTGPVGPTLEGRNAVLNLIILLELILNLTFLVKFILGFLFFLESILDLISGPK